MTTSIENDHFALLKEAEQFLYLEADLLDERRFRDWLALLHEDIEYIVPIRRNVPSAEADRDYSEPGRGVLLFDEGKDTLTQRVEQLETGLHWADEPVSRISHLVTNVRVAATDQDSITVSCRFLVYRNRLDTETDILVGRRRDTLQYVNDRLLLRKRVALIDQSVLLAKNLTFFF